MAQTATDLNALKAGGIIKQRQDDFFLVRLKITLGELSSAQLAGLGEIAREFGRGKVHITTRQGIEIPWVRLADIEAVTSRLAAVGIRLGAGGPRVRVIVACQGNDVCPHALGSTRELGMALDERFFGRSGPSKVKMGVTGCPNSCAKPQQHDIGFMAVTRPGFKADGECASCGLCAKGCKAGAIEVVDGSPVFDYGLCQNDGECVNVCPKSAIEARKTGWNMYVGGKWGRRPRTGQLFQGFLSQEESVQMVEMVLGAWNRLARPKERLGDLIDRIGLDPFRQEVLAAGGGECPGAERSA